MRIKATLGEPGLGPGQGDAVDALRTAVIEHQGSGAGRGYHAVGLGLDLTMFRASSGAPHELDGFNVGDATVTGIPGRRAAGEPGFDTWWNRLVGARRNEEQPGAAIRGLSPSPLDAQTMTVYVEVPDEAGTGTLRLPLWSGYAGIGPQFSADARRDAYSVQAREYPAWWSLSPLTAEFVEPAYRSLPSQPVNARIRRILSLAGYVETSTANRFNPRAVINSDLWDFFLPRRTQQQLQRTDSVLCQADEITAARAIPIQSYIQDLALIDGGGRVVSHQGIGPVRRPGVYPAEQVRVGPDHLNVPAAFGFPKTEVQIDWGGVLLFLKPEIDEDGLYTSGGLESGVTVRPGGASGEGEVNYASIEIRAAVEKTLNMARWSRSVIGEDGRLSLGPSHTIIAARVTKLWSRKHGIRPHERAGLMFTDDEQMLETASRYIASWMAPRPIWKIRLVTGPGSVPVEQIRAAAVLAVGHLVTVETDRGETVCVVNQVTDQLTAGVWVRELHVTPDRVDLTGGVVGPRPPIPKTYGVLGDVADQVDTTAHDIESDPFPPPGTQYGPRLARVRNIKQSFIPESGTVMLFWAHPRFAGDLGLHGWDAELEAGCEYCDGTHGIELAVDHPWQMWARTDNDSIAQGNRLYGTLRARMCFGSIEYWSTPKERAARLDAAETPSEPTDVRVIRQPGSQTAVNVGMVWPERAGSVAMRRFDIEKADGTQGPRPNDLSPVAVGWEFGAGAGVVKAMIDNGGGAQNSPPAIVPVEAYAPLAPVTTDVPGAVSEIAVYRSTYNGLTRVDVLMGAAPAGTGGAAVSGEIQAMNSDGDDIGPAIPFDAATWNVGHSQFGVNDTQTGFKARVRNASGWGPWSATASLPEVRRPSVPRTVTAVRTSSTRKACDGYMLIFATPADPGNVPNPVGYTVTPDPGTEVTGASSDQTNILFDTAEPGEIDIELKAVSKLPSGALLDGDVAGLAIPELPHTEAVRDLYAQYESPTSDNIVWVGHKPLGTVRGDPYQYRAALVGDAWLAPFTPYPADSADRAALPTVAGDRTATNLIDVQARTEGEDWADVAKVGVAVPAYAARPNGPGDEPGTPGVVVRYAEPAVTAPAAARTGETVPTVDPAKAFTMVIFLSEPDASKTGARAASYFVEVWVNDEWRYWAVETRSDGLIVQVPISDLRVFTSAYAESPDRPGVHGNGWVRVKVTAQSAAGLNADGVPANGGTPFEGYFPLPQFPDLRGV